MRSRGFWVEGAGSFVIAILVALAVRWALLEAYVIPSSSMLPTLVVNDHIFVNKVVYGLRLPFTEKWLAYFWEPGRGEVVVFKHPENRNLYFIKRVVGVPGDRIFFENNNLYVNDQLVEKSVPKELAEDYSWVRDSDFLGEDQQGGRENYVHWQESLDSHVYSVILRKSAPPGQAYGPYTVPQGHLFVLGDNRDNSQDSREWDPQASRAQGEVVFSRGKPGGAVKIPAGTVVRSDQPGLWSQRFRTLEDMELTGDTVRVRVRALESGALGNVSAGQVSVIEGALNDSGLEVNNPEAFSGGADKRFVPRDLLIGRAMFVWLSCEKKLPVVTFLCHPMHIRWGRIFHSIQ